MGTCPASSHVKASEVIRTTGSPAVNLETSISVQSPHMNYSVCTYHGKRCGHLIVVLWSFPEMLLRDKSALGAVSYQMGSLIDSPVSMQTASLCHPGYGHFTAFWDSHSSPPTFPGHRSVCSGWVVAGLDWPQHRSPENYVWCIHRMINCLSCAESGQSLTLNILCSPSLLFS